MIVKNEAHIITNTLSKLLDKIKIDYWVICDTGSTDGTQDCIQRFFQERGISGELHNSEWKNFAHNRTLALEHAYKKSDYVFVWDADDEIVGDFRLPEKLDGDWYSFTFGPINTYIRPLLFKNTLRWRYVSVIHEYAESCEIGVGSPQLVPGNYHFISGRTGSRNKDPNKYLNDALTLEKAYWESIESKDPMYCRYSFYTATSYNCADKKDKALFYFKKVLAHENWSEEKYVACISIYDIYKALEQEDEGLGYLVRAHTYNPKRAECIYKLVLHYCLKKEYKIAFNYYRLIQDYYENQYVLKTDDIRRWQFVNRFEQEFMLPYYMIIIAERTRNMATGAKMYELVSKFGYTDIPESYINNWIYNIQFFKDLLSDEFRKTFPQYLEGVLRHGVKIQDNCKKILEQLNLIQL